tara:strand:+ start:656 stop:757 length:102 start_codon:yes stop_codon:yes gene_type:complete
MKKKEITDRIKKEVIFASYITKKNKTFIKIKKM